jgi:hypothetical protein
MLRFLSESATRVTDTAIIRTDTTDPIRTTTDTTDPIRTIATITGLNLTGITGIECITVTIIISSIITIATRGTRTNNETLAAAVMRVSNPDCSPLGINR